MGSEMPSGGDSRAIHRSRELQLSPGLLPRHAQELQELQELALCPCFHLR